MTADTQTADTGIVETGDADVAAGAARGADLRLQLAALAARETALAEQMQANAQRLRHMTAARDAADQRAAKARQRYDTARRELSRAAPRRAAAEQMRQRAEAELALLRTEHRLVVSSTIWRSSQPLRVVSHALPTGLRRLLRGGAKLLWWSVTLRLPNQLRQRRAMLPRPPAPAGTAGLPADAMPVARSLLQRFPQLAPLRTYPDLRSGRRLSIVTDSIASGHLYGGVGTALILGALLARRIGADLRLITRFHEADPGQVGSFLAGLGIPLHGDVTCVFSPNDSGADVPVTGSDLFLTTSWWTTYPTRAAIDPGRIIYLLQEDERMFFPQGDERLRCAETLDIGDIHYVVNSELLFRHLTEGDQALPNLARQGCWFEPAFPLASYHDDAEARGKRRLKTFLFYARPKNLRNLYWRGLEAIDAAIQDGILSPDEWDFTFVGRDLEPVALPFGVRPRLLENLPWANYAALIRETDLGLSLIDTPHPSYPPLDLAASGGVAVTNQCGRKLSLSNYSENIFCVPATVAGLKQGLADAVRLVADDRRRAANFARNGIARDWTATLEPVVQRCVQWIG